MSVTLQMLVGVVLLCLGVLLGSTWTEMILHAKHRRQAEERRQLTEEWAAVRATRRQWRHCSRCRAALSERRGQPR
jgi:cell division protein FtsL